MTGRKITALLIFALSLTAIDTIDIQASLWGSYALGLKPVPEKLDPSSKASVGGPGFGGDLTVQFFFPFYYGLTAEYFPIYAEETHFDFEEFGTIDVSASLTAIRLQGLIFFPIGEWIMPVRGTAWQKIVRGFFASVSFGPNYFRSRANVQGVETINRASRIGWCFSAGFALPVTGQTFARLGVETMRIIEAEISLWSVKAGILQRFAF